MRSNTSLAASPSELLDLNGVPRFGTYAGELPPVQLGGLRGAYALPAPLRLFKRKRWHYLLACTDEVCVLAAVVNLGYAANAFACVVDLRTQRRVFDASFLGAPALAPVSETAGEGHRSAFFSPLARFDFSQPAGADRLRVQVRAHAVGRGKLSLDAQLQVRGGAPALAVISPLPKDGIFNTTQKRAGRAVSGQVQVGQERWSLDGGVGGTDYTHGLLARHTAWNWAFAQGRLPDGTPVGVNLVAGFNEAPEANENALWLGDTLHPLSRAQFQVPPVDLLEPWRVCTLDGAVDLRFRPIHAHREERDLLVVKSHFVQPVGLFEGTVKVKGRTHAVTLPGVTEEQDVLW